jgi:Zn finger protein HypA/HybF involved in hydrogenase expression
MTDITDNENDRDSFILCPKCRFPLPFKNLQKFLVSHCPGCFEDLNIYHGHTFKTLEAEVLKELDFKEEEKCKLCDGTTKVDVDGVSRPCPACQDIFEGIIDG